MAAQKVLINLSYYNWLKCGIVTEEPPREATVKILIDISELELLLQSNPAISRENGPAIHFNSTTDKL